MKQDKFCGFIGKQNKNNKEPSDSAFNEPGSLTSLLQVQIMNNASKFISTFWLLCIAGLPIAVYLGATLANIAGVPYAACHPYDASTAAFASILIGIPLAITITVLTAMPILNNDTALKVWMALTGTSLVSITLFIIYHSGWCK